METFSALLAIYIGRSFSIEICFSIDIFLPKYLDPCKAWHVRKTNDWSYALSILHVEQYSSRDPNRGLMNILR